MTEQPIELLLLKIEVLSKTLLHYITLKSNMHVLGNQCTILVSNQINKATSGIHTILGLYAR